MSKVFGDGYLWMQILRQMKLSPVDLISYLWGGDWVKLVSVLMCRGEVVSPGAALATDGADPWRSQPLFKDCKSAMIRRTHTMGKIAGGGHQSRVYFLHIPVQWSSAGVQPKKQQLKVIMINSIPVDGDDLDWQDRHAEPLSAVKLMLLVISLWLHMLKL